MRKRIKNVLEGLHILLIFSMILPVIYMIGTQREAGTLIRLYAAGYLILVPLLILKLAARRSSGLPVYLAAGVTAVVAAGAIARLVGSRILPEETWVGFLLYMLTGTVLIAMEEYSVRINRIRRKRAREKMDISWRQKEYTLDKPHLYVCLWYVVMYLTALNFDCPEVCNLSVLSFFLYLIIAVIYLFIEKTEEYLNINDAVCHVQNIPYKRIFGIGKYFLLSFLLVTLLSAVPTVLTIPLRQYRDMREWLQERNADYAELLALQEARENAGDPMQDVVLSYGEAREMPFFIKMLFCAIGVVFLAAALRAVFRWIREEFRDFKAGVDEDGDIVETLLPETEAPMVWKHDRRQRTKEEQIRREYRRFIRKNRKDRPALYETPREIETLAGVADTVEGKELHERYELARYGYK